MRQLFVFYTFLLFCGFLTPSAFGDNAHSKAVVLMSELNPVVLEQLIRELAPRYLPSRFSQKMKRGSSGLFSYEAVIGDMTIEKLFSDLDHDGHSQDQFSIHYGDDGIIYFHFHLPQARVVSELKLKAWSEGIHAETGLPLWDLLHTVQRGMARGLTEFKRIFEITTAGLQGELSFKVSIDSGNLVIAPYRLERFDTDEVHVRHIKGRKKNGLFAHILGELIGQSTLDNWVKRIVMKEVAGPKISKQFFWKSIQAILERTLIPTQMNISHPSGIDASVQLTGFQTVPPIAMATVAVSFGANADVSSGQPLMDLDLHADDMPRPGSFHTLLPFSLLEDAIEAVGRNIFFSKIKTDLPGMLYRVDLTDRISVSHTSDGEGSYLLLKIPVSIKVGATTDESLDSPLATISGVIETKIEPRIDPTEGLVLHFQEAHLNDVSGVNPAHIQTMLQLILNTQMKSMLESLRFLKPSQPITAGIALNFNDIRVTPHAVVCGFALTANSH